MISIQRPGQRLVQLGLGSWTMSASGAASIPYSNRYVPPLIYQLLIAGKQNVGYRDYTTQAEAYLDVSEACVEYGRGLIGLPLLPRKSKPSSEWDKFLPSVRAVTNKHVKMNRTELQVLKTHDEFIQAELEPYRRKFV